MDQRRELWAIRDRLDDIEDRVAGLTLEVRDVRSNVPEEENPSANLSDLVGRNITVRFDRNSTQLNAEYRVLLNEVFEQLARSGHGQHAIPDHEPIDERKAQHKARGQHQLG